MLSHKLRLIAAHIAVVCVLGGCAGEFPKPPSVDIPTDEPWDEVVCNVRTMTPERWSGGQHFDSPEGACI